MQDKLLTLATARSVTTSDTTNAIGYPGIDAYVFASDTLPISAIEGLDPSMSLIITPTTSFATSGTCLVRWQLISTFSSNILTEVVAYQYLIHWDSGPQAASAFVAGRRMYTIPLSPQREHRPYLTVLGLFTTDGLSAGAVNLRIERPETMAKFPPANAI